MHLGLGNSSQQACHTASVLDAADRAIAAFTGRSTARADAWPRRAGRRLAGGRSAGTPGHLGLALAADGELVTTVVNLGLELVNCE